jgi:hypothetical protein
MKKNNLNYESKLKLFQKIGSIDNRNALSSPIKHFSFPRNFINNAHIIIFFVMLWTDQVSIGLFFQAYLRINIDNETSRNQALYLWFLFILQIHRWTQLYRGTTLYDWHLFPNCYFLLCSHLFFRLSQDKSFALWVLLLKFIFPTHVGEHFSE